MILKVSGIEIAIPDIIVLPTDGKLVAKLRKKLEEYRRRLSDPRYNKYKVSITLKAEILGRTLRMGKVNTSDLLYELSAAYVDTEILDDRSRFEYIFADACVVIHAYCTTGGEGILEGTGLPKD